MLGDESLKGDWYIRTRTAQDIKTRVNVLIKNCEKQYDDRNISDLWLKRNLNRNDDEGGSK